MNPEPAFDLDLSFGQAGEEWLRVLMDDATACTSCGQPWRKLVEVKRERDKWKETRNLFFEYEYRGAPSGIAATQADWWFIILTDKDTNEGVLGFPVKRLRQRLRELHQSGNAKTVAGGDFNRTKGMLVPMRDLDYLLL